MFTRRRPAVSYNAGYVPATSKTLSAVMAMIVFAISVVTSVTAASTSAANAAYKPGAQCLLFGVPLSGLATGSPSVYLVGLPPDPTAETFPVDTPPNNPVSFWEAPEGAGAIIGARDQRATLYEVVGMTGTSWTQTAANRQVGEYKFTQVGGHEDREDEDEWQCNLLDPALNMAANYIFDSAKTVTALTLKIRAWATNPEPFLNLMVSLSDPLAETFGGEDGMFVLGATVALMATGIYLIFGAMSSAERRRKATRAVLGAIIITGLGMLLMKDVPVTRIVDGETIDDEQPVFYAITQRAIGVGNGLSAAIASGFLADPNEDDVCAADGEDVSRRSLDCRVYKATVFDPWAQGQFGDIGKNPISIDGGKPRETRPDRLRFAFPEDGSPPGPPAGSNSSEFAPDTDVRLLQLWAGAVTGRQYHVDPPCWERDTGQDLQDCRSMAAADFGNTAVLDRMGEWNHVRDYMWHNQQSNYQLWRGGEAMTRLSLATIAVLMAVLMAVFIVAVSILALVWNCVLVVLFFAMPVVMLVAMFPPTQKVAKDWLTTWTKALSLTFVYQVAQVFALFVLSAVLDVAESAAWTALMMIALAVALFKLVKATMQMGGTMFDPSGAVGSFAAKAASTGKRAAGGATKRVGRVGAAAGVGAVGGALARRKAVRDGDVKKKVRDHNKGRSGRLKQERDRNLRRQEREHVEKHGRSMNTLEKAAARRRADAQARETVNEIYGEKATVSDYVQGGALTGAAAAAAGQVVNRGGRHGNSAIGRGLDASRNAVKQDTSNAPEASVSADQMKADAEYKSVGAQRRSAAAKKATGWVAGKAAAVGGFVASGTQQIRTDLDVTRRNVTGYVQGKAASISEGASRRWERRQQQQAVAAGQDELTRAYEAHVAGAKQAGRDPMARGAHDAMVAQQRQQSAEEAAVAATAAEEQRRRAAAVLSKIYAKAEDGKVDVAKEKQARDLLNKMATKAKAANKARAQAEAVSANVSAARSATPPQPKRRRANRQDKAALGEIRQEWWGGE